MRSMRPWTVPEIQRMSSGTSLPAPRTSRTIGPRFTVPNQTVLAGAVGEAGLRPLTTKVIATTAAPPSTASTIRRIFFRLRIFGIALDIHGHADDPCKSVSRLAQRRKILADRGLITMGCQGRHPGRCAYGIHQSRSGTLCHWTRFAPPRFTGCFSHDRASASRLGLPCAMPSGPRRLEATTVPGRVVAGAQPRLPRAHRGRARSWPRRRDG